MTAHIADEIGSDGPLHAAPVPVAALESVLVATANDRLQSRSGQRLENGEVRPRDRRARLFVDLARDIGRDMLGPRRAVVVDDQAVPEHLLDRVSAADRPGGARKGG